MQVPSGRVFDTTDLHLLRLMHDDGFVGVKDRPVTLRSGIKSRVYVAGRSDLTESPALMGLVGKKICQVIHQHWTNPDQSACLVGIPTAGTTLAIAAAMMSVWAYGGPPVLCRQMRPVKKTHGEDQTWVEGKPDVVHHHYWLLDNVATSGDSVLEAERKLLEDGYPAKPPVFIWIDRQQGGVERLKAAGFEQVVVAYYLLDITYAYHRLGLWSEETAQGVEDEIKAHQFL
jgi:orotate phosphoribosyltransferase